MKKQILTFGKTLNRAEQKSITGGFGLTDDEGIECKDKCTFDHECPQSQSYCADYECDKDKGTTFKQCSPGYPGL